MWYNTRMMEQARIRAAELRDAERIFALISLNRDQLVPRSIWNIVENIDRFVIAEAEGEMVGCAAYQIHPVIGDAQAAIVEIVSVAVKSMFRRRGIGRLLVEAVIANARRFNPREVLVLTFAPEFFGRLGFETTPKTEVMHKLYTGCINCTKHADPFTCPEIAMKRTLGNGPVIGFADVRRELAAGNRVLLLVRHAERPRIDHEDRTFGAAVPLTANGERMCVDFGKALAGAAETVQFRASPLRRTVMSAELIAQGMGVAAPEIVEDDEIGNGSAFFADRGEVWQCFRDGHFFEVMLEYMAKGEMTGFAPIAAATAAYEDHVVPLFTAQLGIFTTHDVFVAAYLFGKGVKTDWSPDNWPRFLDAAAIVIEPSGRRRYALLRAGLSDRVTGVS